MMPPRITRTRKRNFYDGITMSSTIEKESLEAHVDLCAERFGRLEEKYQELKEVIDNNNIVVHERIERVKDSIVSVQHSLEEHRLMAQEHFFKQNRIMITSAVAVVVAVIGSIATHILGG